MKLSRKQARNRRKQRIKKKVSGSQERPRLVVFRSNKHIYAQVVDDTMGHTRAASSTLSLPQAQSLSTDNARQVGLELAKKAQEQQIQRVVFDRNGFKYHGRVKALADGAREGGLQF
jgi:large subunit ribosomal protein L18